VFGSRSAWKINRYILLTKKKKQVHKWIKNLKKI
jgi:hypothetical protein